MSFPFSVKHAVRLEARINSDDYPLILEHISKFIKNKGAEDIVIQNNVLNFKSHISERNHIMEPVNKGIFSLIEQDGVVTLIYNFFMFKHIIVITSILAIVMGMVSQNLIFAFFAFLALCGMNWFIPLARQRHMLDDLAAEIELLIQEKKL